MHVVLFPDLTSPFRTGQALREAAPSLRQGHSREVEEDDDEATREVNQRKQSATGEGLSSGAGTDKKGGNSKLKRTPRTATAPKDQIDESFDMPLSNQTPPSTPSTPTRMSLSSKCASLTDQYNKAESLNVRRRGERRPSFLPSMRFDSPVPPATPLVQRQPAVPYQRPPGPRYYQHMSPQMPPGAPLVHYSSYPGQRHPAPHGFPYYFPQYHNYVTPPPVTQPIVDVHRERTEELFGREFFPCPPGELTPLARRKRRLSDFSHLYLSEAGHDLNQPPQKYHTDLTVAGTVEGAAGEIPRSQLPPDLHRAERREATPSSAPGGSPSKQTGSQVDKNKKSKGA